MTSTDELYNPKLFSIQNRFLEYLAKGEYFKAQSFLTNLRLKASSERDKTTYYFVSYLLGICYQQQGQLVPARSYLTEILKESSSLTLRLRATIHFGKILSQSTDYRAASSLLTDALSKIRSLEKKSRLTTEEAHSLRLPILWRLGVEESIIGRKKQGAKHFAQHGDLASDSPYQQANRLACEAILLGSGDIQFSIEDVENAIIRACNIYSAAPEDKTNAYAFRNKPLLGMLLLKSTIDFLSERRFESYVKIHIVRHYMKLWGILPWSEGFAEMIFPVSPTFPQLVEFLTLDEFNYESWIAKQSDEAFYREARNQASELINAIEDGRDAKFLADMVAGHIESPKINASIILFASSRLIAELSAIKNVAIDKNFLSVTTKLGKERTMRDINCFIVHGHDEHAKLALKNYLQNTLKLPEPVILHEKASRGRTIIEKFEDYADKVSLVFVLLTPDDKMVDADTPENEKYRARQNVIFEMGYFLGKIGRPSGAIILLYKGRLDLPSNISGIVYIDISKGIDAAGETIRKELVEYLGE